MNGKGKHYGDMVGLARIWTHYAYILSGIVLLGYLWKPEIETSKNALMIVVGFWLGSPIQTVLIAAMKAESKAQSGPDVTGPIEKAPPGV